MEPDALAGDALDPQIDSRDMQFELPEEFGFPQMREKPISLHRQIRGVDLEDHASVVDRAILVGQRFRESRQIGLVTVVVLIKHCSRDYAR